MDHGHVLIVDDDKGHRNTTRLILEHVGYSVSLARDGEEALERVHAAPVDVIVMDIRMPGKSGVEVFEQIRGEGSKAKVIFLTAYVIDEVADRALEAGAAEVLRKPVQVERLLSLLEALCRDKGES